MKRTIKYVFLVLLLAGLSPVLAQETGWPRTVALDEGTVTIYEPQVDEMSDDFVRFRAALAYREKPGGEPVFGAGWFESELQVDRFSGTAHPVGMKVTQTRFPVEADVQSRLSEAMAQPSFAANFSFSLDELEQSEKATRAEKLASEQLNTEPPKIIYRDKPALLVNIDGDPVIRDIENSRYEAVINTPYPLIRDRKDYYLNAADGVWYRAGEATGPYRYEDAVPAGILDLVKPDGSDDGESRATLALSEKVTAANAPEIVVSTEPAELIVTEGPAAFVPLVDDLLVLNNSDDDVFLHLGEQQYYIVLAGRWYRSKSLAGPWSYHDSNSLPAAFAQIPAESDQADSRVHVAGTEEANEAVLEAQVPQTAAVKRGEADVEVQYDGDPEFEPVDGTEMVYAANTGSTVIHSDGLYYLVEDGVWYVSTSPNGPWSVAVARPDQVRVILPSSPVYNVKYVYVYGYTPDVVYVGYTPGYLGSYVYGSTVFYGSGWYYRPWVSPRYYYPHHSTWGFHVRYDPWYGWNFGLSWAWGPFSFSYWPGGYWHHHHHWHHRHYGYWGPHGYRPRHHHHRPPHYRPPGHRPPGHGGGNRPHPYERHRNLYADSHQRAPVAGTRDKPVNVHDKGRRNGSFTGEAYAKSYKQGQLPKNKSVAAAGKLVNRSELAHKAKKRNEGFQAAKGKVISRSSGKSYSKAYASSLFKASPGNATDRKVTRNDLAGKAKTAYATSRSKTAPAGKTKTYTKPVKVPKAGVSRKDLDRVKVADGNRTAKTVVQSRKKYVAPPSKTVVRPTSRNSTQATGSRSYTKATTSARVPSKVAATKSYSRQKSMPKVTLTRPQKQGTYAYNKPKSAAPARQVQNAPRQQQYSKPVARQQSGKASAPKQYSKQSVPKKSAPTRNKQNRAK